MTIRVVVRFFAVLRERAGTERIEVTLDSARTAALRADLVARFGDTFVAELFGSRNRIALNQTLLDDVPETLADADEIAFLPPVTGG